MEYKPTRTLYRIMLGTLLPAPIAVSFILVGLLIISPTNDFETFSLSKLPLYIGYCYILIGVPSLFFSAILELVTNRSAREASTSHLAAAGFGVLTALLVSFLFNNSEGYFLNGSWVLLILGALVGYIIDRISRACYENSLVKDIWYL